MKLKQVLFPSFMFPIFVLLLLCIWFDNMFLK